MALIRCPECCKDISDKADRCPNCGYPIVTSNKESKFTQRLVFGIITVGLSLFIIVACIANNILENIHLMASAVHFLIPGMIILIGKKSKIATIVSSGIYIYVFFVCFGLSIYHSQTIIIGLLSLGFGIPLLINGIKQPHK
ncbi:MAG TPA: hypothetical protein GXX75_09145 [Clostridiales bacterium]|nr:hypothetical protein [Clostridiales bacterium]